MNIPPKYEDVVAKLEAALAHEDSMREELGMVRKAVPNSTLELVSLQQRLTVAEKRAGELEELLRECQPALEKAGYSTWQIDEALKPAAEGEGS